MTHPWEGLRAQVRGLPPREAATQLVIGVIAQVRVSLQHGGRATVAELLDKLEEMLPSMIDATERETAPTDKPSVDPAPVPPAAAPKHDPGPQHQDLPMPPPVEKGEVKPGASTTRPSLGHTHDSTDTHPAGKHGKGR